MADTSGSNQADIIYDELAPDSEFPSVAVDLSGDQFSVPAALNNPLYQNVARAEFTDLTTEETDGAGVFDKMMNSINEHLRTEFEANRITGQEYTKAYIELTTAALSSSIQFLFQKETNYYQNILTLMQGRAAEAQAVSAAAQVEEQKQSVLLAQFSALKARADFALSKMQLSISEANFDNICQNTKVAEQQEQQIIAERTTIDYRRLQILPEERRQLIYQTDEVLRAGVEKVNFETDHILPAQRNNLNRDADIKQYQLNNTLPQQFKLLKEQTEVQHAQTQDTRIGTDDPVTGAVGRQKELYAEQISSYIKNDQYRVAKMYLDSWITQKSLDEGLNAPPQLTNTNIDQVLSRIRNINELNVGG